MKKPDPSKIWSAWDALVINDSDAVPPGKTCAHPSCGKPATHVIRRRSRHGGLQRSYVCRRHWEGKQ